MGDDPFKAENYAQQMGYFWDENPNYHGDRNRYRPVSYNSGNYNPSERVGDWSNGIGNSDWTLTGGSELYKEGLAAGLVDIGGDLFDIGIDEAGNTTFTKAFERNGKLGFWDDQGDGYWKGFETRINGETIRLKEFIRQATFVPIDGPIADPASGIWDWIQLNVLWGLRWENVDGEWVDVDENGYKFKNYRAEGVVTDLPIGPGGGAKGVIASYKVLKKVTQGWRGLIQAHHIVEVRHLKALGLSTADAPSFVLSRTQHQQITNKLFELLPKGATYSKQQIIQAYKQAYKEFPEWIKAAENYLGL